MQPGAKWVLFEGADGSTHARSVPIDKVLDDALIVYGQNGERLRPENGYPLRAFIPGWEGNVSVKWLRRIKVGDQPWHFRSETARYTDPMPEGKWRQFSFVMECKSVITRPSGGMKLTGPGSVRDRGLRLVGQRHASRAVDVTVDGGRNWQQARLEEPVLDKCLTRFRYTLELGRRAGEDREPRRRQHRLRPADGRGHRQGRARSSGFVQHHNGDLPVVGQRRTGRSKMRSRNLVGRRARRCWLRPH